MEKPKRYIIKKVDINETGISISGLKAILQSRKNKKMIRITSISEIKIVSATSVTERLIKTVVSIAISVL
jgi:CRISPR/Cas system-associated endonuclease Cas1